MKGPINEDLNEVKRQIEHYVSIYHKNHKERTALIDIQIHLQVYKGSTALLKGKQKKCAITSISIYFIIINFIASEKGYLNKVKFLVENGENVNHRNLKGNTALAIGKISKILFKKIFWYVYFNFYKS